MLSVSSSVQPRCCHRCVSPHFFDARSSSGFESESDLRSSCLRGKVRLPPMWLSLPAFYFIFRPIANKKIGPQVKNIPAALMGTAQKDKSTAMSEMKAGKYRLVYVTPEWCTSDGAVQLLQEMASGQTAKLTLVAIDEAHCVSQWGMDFRKSYR